MTTQGGAKRVRLGLPKGSLQSTTESLFKKAGYDLRIAERSYTPKIDDPEIECVLIRAQEMARYVQQGVLDAGITGIDWTLENRARVKQLADLVAPWPNYNPVRWVVAVKEDSKVRRPADLAGKRIATEVVHLTRTYLRKHGVKARVEFSWGATEVKPPLLADAIVDVTETGSSLRANRLRIIDTVVESNTQLIANPKAMADPWKATKLDNIALLLKAAIEAQGRVGIMLNVMRADLDQVLALLPALQRPTISPLSDPEWVAINTIIEERTVRDLIPRLKGARAHGIVEYPLNKIVM
jgi:ATP phosphoribosyltransferase